MEVRVGKKVDVRDSKHPGSPVLTFGPDEWAGFVGWVKAGTVGPSCTGLTARWCPVHGDCICPRPDNELGGDLADPMCPLHSPDSRHASEDDDGSLKAGTLPGGEQRG